MAYGVKYRCQHKTTTQQTETTYLIEILEDGYGGSVTDVKGKDDVFNLSYEKIDVQEPFKSPIQKGRLEFYLAVGGRTSYDGIAILNEIFQSDEGQYRVRLKKDGNILWTGSVLSDLLEYPDGQYVFSGKIVAKDLTRLKGFDFPLTTSRDTVIGTIADLLDDLGLGLDIYTYTSWTEDSISTSDDFLNQIYNDETALRKFANNGDETDQPITNEKALTQILKNYGLILRQIDNAWRLYQYSALKDATSVDQYRYDSTGTQISSSTTDLTVNVESVDTFVLPGSMNQFNPALKEAKARFEHRSVVSNNLLPSQVSLTGQSTQDFTGFINTDGTQRISFSTDIRARMDLDQDPVTASIAIGAGGYWWNEEARNWDSSFVYNNVRLAPGHVDPDWQDFMGGFETTTEELPADADGTLTFRYRGALGATAPSQNTEYLGNSYSILNPSVAEGNSTAVEFKLIQAGDYSAKYETDKLWFGDGPSVNSPGALTTDSGGSNLTSDSWKRKGEPSSSNFYNVLLSELLDTQRSTTRNFDAEIKGDFKPTDLLNYSGSNLFFLGGDLTGKNNEWKGNFLELNVVTSSFDSFNKIYKTSDEDESGGSAPTGDSSGGGISQDVGDNRYVNRSGDTMYGQLILNDGLDVNGNTVLDNIGISGNTISSITGDITINPAGDLFVNGDTIEVDKELTTTDNLVVLNSGESGSGVTNGTSGIRVDRGSSPYYEFLFRESDNVFAIGESGSLQAVATREDNPTNDYLARWNSSSYRFDTINLASIVGGTTNQVNVSDDGDGSITLGLPQDIHTAADPTFSDLTLTDTLTINGTQLFDKGQEQKLDTDSNVNFNNLTLDGLLDLNGGKIIDLNEIEGRGDDKIEIYNSNGASDSRTYLELYGGESGKVGEAHLGGNSIHFFTGVTTTGTGSNDITFNNDGSATFRKDINFYTRFVSDDYSNGIFGNGTLLDNDASEGSFFEVDNMRIRNTLRTHIFKKDIIRASNAYLYISDASEIADTITTPSTTGQSFVFTVKEGVFSSGDAIEYKDADENDGSIYHVSASVTDNGTSRTLNGKTVYDYSASLESGTNVQLRAGDTVVRTSGGTILNDASSQFSPFIDVLDNRVTRARLGNLNGINDTINGQSVSGYGLYSDNAFLKGGIVATYGAIGGFDITSNTISDSSNDLILRDNGQITGSNVLFDGGVIAGWEISNTQITSDGASGGSDGGYATSGITLHSTGWISTPEFYIDSSGNASFHGTLTASAGTIGGWSISTSNISAGNLTLNDSGQIVNTTQINSQNAYQLDNDGSGWFAGKNLQWDNAGNLDIQGNVTASNLRIDNDFSLGVSMVVDSGGIITNGGLSPDYTLSDNGIVFAGGSSGKLGIGVSSMARFGEYSGGSNGYMGAIGGYNDDGTISTPTEGNLYLQGGRDSSGNSVGTIHYDAVDHKLNGVLNLDTLSDDSTNPSRMVLPVGADKYAT